MSLRPILILALLAVACTPEAPVPTVAVPVIVVAGPTCPVVSDPPDPTCADRPVEGAELIVLAPDGSEAGRATSDAEGRATLHLAAGSYTLVPQPVTGLMGTAAEMAITVDGAVAPITVAYDTGIR